MASMTAERAKPLPLRTPETAPFLDGLREGRVLLQQCTGCERLRYPGTRTCPNCLSEERSWKSVSGRGHIYSFIIVHQLYQPAFEADLPYNVAIVQLDEGPRVTSNIVGCENHEIRIGLSVEPEFVRVSDEVTVLKFRLVTART
jgi:uncharacterized OB-fold protein